MARPSETTQNQTSDTRVIVAIAQFAATENAKINHEIMVSQAETAARAGAQLLVFPENSNYTQSVLGLDYVENSQHMDGPFCLFLSELSQRLKITIAAGFAEKSDQPGKCFNTVVVFGETGELVCHYRKMHLYDAFAARESEFVLHGESDGELPIFELAGFRFGLQICFDLRFPELSRRLALAGCDALIVSSQWIPGQMKHHHWNTLLTARAIENTVYVLASDQSPPRGVGLSCVIDPNGIVVAQAWKSQGVFTTELSQDTIGAIRKTNPSLSLRRVP